MDSRIYKDKYNNKLIVGKELITNFSKIFFPLVSLFLLPGAAHAGQLFLGPATGSFTVGSTFDVQVLLNTDNQSVNALDVDLRFPADRLQLVSPKTSVSVIEVWTSQPKFNNQTGTVRLQGGIPRGINVNNALVATLTFRVKSVGNAIIRFGDNSKILLNDGLGTNDLRRKGDAVYTLLLPPPAGPIVVSETHSNQGQWYANSNLVLRWSSGESVDGYSYILDTNPVTIPDDVSDGRQESVVYKDLADNQYYFHIKSYRNGGWGGTTHFAVNIDTEPPAEFPVEILPGTRTSIKDPVIKFSTTDTKSGIDHYELKIVSLSNFKEKESGNENNSNSDQDFFIEAESPYISPDLELGSYDVIVRSIDKAGNIREITKRFVITNGFFSWSSSEGVILGSILISWPWLIVILLIVIGLLIYYGSRAKRRHESVQVSGKYLNLPDSVRDQLEELRRYKSRYGKTSLLFLALLISSVIGGVNKVNAEEVSGMVELAPPYVSTVSRNVSNDEIFYLGGKTENKDTTVVIYTQNLSTGETTSYEVTSNKKGEWFYRHNSFLTPGNYVLWTQAKIGDISSPPSPQIEMRVERAAISLGATRISYETLYATVTGILLLIVLWMIIYIFYHLYHEKRKRIIVMKEIREAEESIKRGFALLRRDIEEELQVLKKYQLSRDMSPEEKRKEEILFRDLKDIESRIGKEIWDVEKVETK